MILSVIIVHYRVPYFLELCLLSVGSALKGLEAEILVIDNNSTDQSPDLLRSRFPRVKWIFNPENLGFARACNQGLAFATGDHILFLNPDTILPEDFARNCLAFYKQASNPPGALGVRMIDGRGRFLKESRRGFPTPWVAFCRLSGLAALFPRSRWFSRYYLGYLPADRTHPAPVLSGACLWVSREALNAAGPFDDDFYMYAEDIDLSYRLQKAGFCNYYLADITIIHFKGASTQKDLRYIRQFYGAMSQFRQKHLNSGMNGLFRAGLELAIRTRAAFAAAGQAFGKGERSRPASARRTWITGDPASVRQVWASVARSRAIVSDPQDATETIFCQGPAFSFKDLISALEKITGDRTAGIYAAGAGAMVVSMHRDNRAEILKL